MLERISGWLAIVVVMILWGCASDLPEAQVKSNLRLEPSPTPQLYVYKCASPADQEYLEATFSSLEFTAIALGSVGQLSTEAGNNPDLVLSEDWQFEMAATLSFLTYYADRIKNDLKPSDHLRQYHNALVGIADTLDEIVTLMTKGYETFDGDSLWEAIPLITGLPARVDDAIDLKQAACN